MTSEYDQVTVFHYAAFRPALHLIILKECFAKEEVFALGLDIGCGTGQSSIALTNFCNQVIGIDPSKEMLQKSIKHPNVEYTHYNQQNFDFSDDFFDIVTLAGSLYYAKSQTLLDEIVRVTKNASKIIVYDFELLLEVILEKLNMGNVPKQELYYDHQVNFDGLNQAHIHLEKGYKDYLSLEISISNLSHLLLSSKTHYHLLLQSFKKENLYIELSQKLYSIFKTENILVDAITYSTVYQNIK